MHKTRVQIAEEKAAESATRRTQQAVILKALQTRLGDVPDEIAAKVQAMTDLTALESVFVAALTAESFDGFRTAAGW